MIHLPRGGELKIFAQRLKVQPLRRWSASDPGRGGGVAAVQQSALVGSRVEIRVAPPHRLGDAIGGDGRHELHAVFLAFDQVFIGRLRLDKAPQGGQCGVWGPL